MVNSQFMWHNGVSRDVFVSDPCVEVDIDDVTTISQRQTNMN